MWLDDVRRDLQYAARTLRRAPGFTTVVVLTLGLGIGANTAIFSVVRAVVISPLPFKSPERLVQLYENVPAAETPNNKALRTGVFARDVAELAAQSKLLSHVTTRGSAIVTVQGSADAQRQKLASVSIATFPMLDVQPVLGRWLAPGDDQPGRNRLIVLSYGAWQRYFGGDPQAPGKSLTFNGDDFGGKVAFGLAYVVVGVMPRGFHFPDDDTQFWIPLAVSPAPEPRPARTGLIARLADGVSPQRAASEAAAILEATRGVPPGSYLGAGGAPRFEFIRVQDEMNASVKPAVLVLTVAVGCVLLIACANVANLLLARTATRQREIAVRVAIGAGRGRLVRQVLTESVLLSAIGGALGTVLAGIGVRLFRVLATSLARVDLGSTGTTFPRLDAIAIDQFALVFAAAVSIGTGLLFGLAPAWRASRMDGLRARTAATAGSLGRRDRTRGVLVVAEIALATVLLIASGLLIRSFGKLVRVELGYDPANVVTFQVSLPGARRPSQQLKVFAEDLVGRLRSLPGVEAAGYANQLPLVGLMNSIRFATAPADPSMPPPPTSPDVRLVSQDYVRAMGIRVLAGRGFEAGDDAGRPRVVVINAKLAQREFGDRSPVGTTVYVGSTPAPWQIVGVVQDVRQRGLDQEPRPQVFVDMRQWSGPGVAIFPVGTYYSVRTTQTAAAIANIRAVVQQQERGAALENVATMEQIVSNSVTVPRMYTVLLGIFAGVAMTLAVAGIYGVVAYAVTQRTREIGIRMALGARRGQVLALVLRQSLGLVAIGLLLGVAGAAAGTRYLEGLLFGLTPLDRSTFAYAAAAFALVAAAAAYIPALRATVVNPLEALRCE